MPAALRPFIVGTALWAVALVALLLGLEIPGIDRGLAIGTCIAALVLGLLGYAYMWPRRPRSSAPQE